MSNIEDIKSKRASIHSKYFFAAVLLVLTLGRTWGLLDEFLLGRFLLLSCIVLIAYLFFFPIKVSFRINLLDLAFVLYLLMAYSSLMWAHLPSAGYLTVQTVLLSFAYYMGFRLLFRQLSLGFVLNGLALLSAVTVCIAGFQLARLGWTTGINNDNIYVVTGMSAHKNLLASFLFILLGFNMFSAVAHPGKKWLYALIGIQILVIFLLRSRAALLAVFMGGFIVLLYQILTKEWNKKRFLRRYLPIAGVSILLALVLFFGLGGSTQTLKSLSPSEYRKSSSGAERLFVWYKTRQLIKDRWLSGYGAGNWKIVFPSKSIGGAYRLQSLDVTMTRAHNDYLEIWAELGITGLLAYLSIFMIALAGIFYAFLKSTPSIRTRLVVLVSVLIGYMIIAYFDFPKERIEHQVLWTLLLAYVVDTASFFFQRRGVSWQLSPQVLKYLIGLIMVLLVLNLPLSYFQMKGEYHCRKALEAQAAGVWPIVESEAKIAYSPWYQINPATASVKWIEGLAQFHLAHFEQALTSFDIACHQTPYHVRTLNDYAGCLVQLKKYNEAVPLYLRALFVNPKFEEGMFNIAYVYAQLNQFDEAISWLNKTTSDPKKKTDYMKEIDNLKVQYNHKN